MTFLKQESGAVTVDWVVLTAGLVGLGLATMAVVSTGVQDTAEDIEDQLGADMIVTSFPAAISAVGRPDWQEGFVMVTPGSCDQDACEGDLYVATEPFVMSDGAVWTRVTTANNAELTNGSAVWTNADGETVDAPELGDNYDTAMVTQPD